MRRLLVLLFVAIGLAGSLCGQESDSVPAATIEQLKSRLKTLESDGTVPEASRLTAVSHLQDAIGFLEKKEQFERREAEYRTVLSEGAAEIGQMQAEGAVIDQSQNASLLPSNISKSSSMSQIEEAIAQEQAALASARSELNAIESKSKEEQSSPAMIRDRMIAVKAELDEVDSLLREPSASNNETVDEAKKMALQSRRDSLVAETRMLEQEFLSYDIRIARAGAAGNLAKKRVQLINDRIEAIQALANAQLSSGVDRAETLLRRVRDSEPVANASAAGLIEELENLISETRRVSNQFEDTTTRRQEREVLLREISDDFADVRRQIEMGGLEGSFARILLERVRSLPRALEQRQLLREIRQDLTDTQRRLYFLENSSVSGNPERGASNSADAGETGLLQRDVQYLESARKQLKQDLAANYRRLIRELGELDLVENQIDQESAEYREFLTEQLFWERSSPMIDGGTFRAIFPGLAWAFGPERVSEFVDQLSAFPAGFYIALAVLLAGIIGLRGKFKAELLAAGDQTRRISTDYYLNTIKAFVLTVLLALPLPLALSALGLAFRIHPGATEWSFGMGTALLAIGLFLLIVQFTKEMSAEKGLGEYHFKWDPSNLARVRKLFRRLVPIYIPLSLILSLIIAESSPEHVNGLGRLAALLMVIGTGAVFLLFARPGLDGKTNQVKPASYFFCGKGPFWFIAFVTLGLTVLLLIGFVVTAMILMIEFQASVLAIYAAFVIYGLVLRWFEIKERRMALVEAIAERRSRQEAAEEDEEDVHESEEMLIDEAEKDQRLNLVQVGEQMRNVIRFLVGTALVTTLWYLWTEPAPVLTGLSGIQIVGSFSIADLAVTLLATGVTVSITRNLPGLLEILVFRRLEIAPGTRTAVTTLAQYGVIAIGLAVVSQQVEIDWSQFGWIAAALSVGLGFGLQEVVANFICGIILLFERPIRVGDVVKVAGVSGTVSRIQMRATTIVNWDREEFVVPNKEFITGSLLNMTLSSPINRVIIPVGVAYGSDTEEVLRILSEVARDTDGVMEDPAPVITFEGFGDSSLDFTIRAFLPTRENRLGVITELNRQTDKRFAEAGIEIPFPQRDLHVRTVEEGIQLRSDTKP